MWDSTYRITWYKEPLFLSILGLVLLNFLGVGIYWCYLLLVFFILRFPRNMDLVDKDFLFLLMFSLLYPLCLIINGISLSDISGTVFIGYIFFPTVFYFFGKYMMREFPSIHTVYFLFFFIVVLFSILPFASNVVSVIHKGFMTDRNIRMFWARDEQLRAATGVGSYMAINMALLPLVFIQKGSGLEKRLALFSFLLFGIALFSNLNMSNRTGIVISLTSLVALIAIARNNFRSVLFVSLFLGLMICLYVIDAGHVRSWFETSQVFDRISRTNVNEEGSRMVIWQKAMTGILKFPLGNVNYDIGGQYAHNLWLDVGHKTGFIPMIPLFLVSVSAIVAVIKISLSNRYSIFFRALVAFIGIAFFITFFLEPIMEGFFIMFLIFCFYFGMVTGIRNFLPENLPEMEE